MSALTNSPIPARAEAATRLEEIEKRHGPSPDHLDILYCDHDGEMWPCDTRQVIAVLDAIEAEAIAANNAALAERVRLWIGPRPQSEGAFSKGYLFALDDVLDLLERKDPSHDPA
jgi:hypothetical protein